MLPQNKKTFGKKCIAQVSLLGLCFLLAAPLTFAAEIIDTDIGSFYTFSEYISGVWRWVAQIVFGIGIVAIVIGGLLLAGSGGNEDKADIGRQTVRGGIIGIIITLFSAVFNRFIQTPVGDEDNVSLESAQESIGNAATGFLSVVAAVSAIGIVYAGIKYMTANGDDEKLQSAKSALKFSLLGLAISVGAWAISAFLFSIW